MEGVIVCAYLYYTEHNKILLNLNLSAVNENNLFVTKNDNKKRTTKQDKYKN